MAAARPPLRLPAALGIAAVALWLPPIVPFLGGPLRECSHCVANYLELYPLVPGFWPGFTVGLAFGDADSLLSRAVMAATTLVLLVAVVWALRRGWIFGVIACVLAAGMSAVSAGILGVALRA